MTMDIHKSTTVPQQFNTTIDQWIGFLDRYTIDQLLQQPQPGSWSLGQVYVHIISETKHFLGQVREAAMSFDNEDQTKHPDAEKMFAANSFPDMQLHAPTNANTPQPADKDDLLEELLILRAQANELFELFDLANSNGKTEHPGLSYFTALEWLQFAEMHMRHHLRQKERIDAGA
jgi:hypothetical protein